MRTRDTIFRLIYKLILSDMVAISSLQKNTSAYVNEWVAWHLSLGFDKIFIHDNSEKGNIGDYIQEEYKDKVVIVPIEKDEGQCVCDLQTQVINDFIQAHSEDVDWCAFIDSDEYIHIDNYSSVQEWLSNAPQDVNCVALNWHLYGDDGVIEGDETQPVQERFTHCINDVFERNGTCLGNMSKKILRLNKDIVAEDMFIYKVDNEKMPMYDCNFVNIGGCSVVMAVDCSSYQCYINHYVTKSLSECVKYKCSDLWGMRTFEDYYFTFNERTAEKEAYIREKL